MPANITLPRDLDGQVEALVLKLKRRQVIGSHDVTIETAKLLRNVIAGSKWNDIDSLVSIVNFVQQKLSSAQPIEFASENTARRILHLIHEEKLEFDKDNGTDEDVQLTFRDSMKALVIQGVVEILDEIETANSHISNQALDHIHSNEIIMTIGYSKIVLQFLREAARFRKFQIIISEDSPFFDGHRMAVELASAGIETTLVTDSAVFAIMSRVNKVILGGHAVTADGGLVAKCGSHVVACAAKHHSTPVVVCATLQTMTPNYMLNDTQAYNLCISPALAFAFEDSGEITKNADLPTPYYDYVETELLALIITDVGPFSPSNLSRMWNTTGEIF